MSNLVLLGPLSDTVGFLCPNVRRVDLIWVFPTLLRVILILLCPQVKALVEEERQKLGYGTHQVLFNTDLYGKTSGTYKRWVRVLFL